MQLQEAAASSHYAPLNSISVEQEQEMQNVDSATIRNLLADNDLPPTTFGVEWRCVAFWLLSPVMLIVFLFYDSNIIFVLSLLMWLASMCYCGLCAWKWRQTHVTSMGLLRTTFRMVEFKLKIINSVESREADSSDVLRDSSDEWSIVHSNIALPGLLGAFFSVGHVLVLTMVHLSNMWWIMPIKRYSRNNGHMSITARAVTPTTFFLYLAISTFVTLTHVWSRFPIKITEFIRNAEAKAQIDRELQLNRLFLKKPRENALIQRVFALMFAAVFPISITYRDDFTAQFHLGSTEMWRFVFLFAGFTVIAVSGILLVSEIITSLVAILRGNRHRIRHLSQMLQNECHEPAQVLAWFELRSIVCDVYFPCVYNFTSFKMGGVFVSACASGLYILFYFFLFPPCCATLIDHIVHISSFGQFIALGVFLMARFLDSANVAVGIYVEQQHHIEILHRKSCQHYSSREMVSVCKSAAKLIADHDRYPTLFGISLSPALRKSLIGLIASSTMGALIKALATE